MGHIPQFSVITPCFNSEKTIAKTLESVADQTYRDFEYIIIDGGSTDGTLDIIKSYGPRFDGNIHVYSGPDKGIYDAMDKGIQRANGRSIGIVNSDDFYEPTTLEKVAEHYLPDERYQIIYGMMRVINEEGKELAIEFHHHDNMEKHMIDHPATFVSAGIYEDLGIYSLDYQSASDLDLMLRLYRDGNVKFTPVYEVLTNFRRGGISGSYIGIVETNEIRYKYGLIPRKNYHLTKIKNALKHFTKV